MCGIAGFTHRDRSADRSSIERVTASLFHRGPDQQSVFRSPDICLGAVRLKIVDMNGGNQPFLSPDGAMAVAFNGEIYNHEELRDQLERLGCRFRTCCDTEVVLHAFRQWDLDCFRRFRGMFGVAIWSQPEKRLVLARDRMGIKPLYYYRNGGEIHFGSELKAILGHPGVPRRLDPDALQDYLALNYVPGPRTLIQGIAKLPPGHSLEHRAGQTRLERWWKLEFQPEAGMSPEGAEERLDHLLKESVREHMESDVPLGIWSSGGLDSSTVLHYASQATSKRLKTFSVGFQARCCDESRYFREMAARYGTEHHEVELGPGPELVAAVEDFAYYSDEPGADAGALPMWFLSKMTAEHVTVALSGDGGDELFGGYMTYMADRAARPLRAVPAGVRRGALAFLQRALPVSNRKISFEYKLKRWMEGSLLNPDRAHLFWNGAFSDSERAALTGVRGSGPDLFGNLPGAAEIGFLNRYMLLDQQYYLPDNILYKVDRMSMAHSVEARPAFLDHRIVEFAASLPENLKIRGNRQKYLLKRLMRNKLPESILNRSKKGFDIPTHDWFRGFLKPLLLDTLTENAIESTGIFNFGATQALIRDHMERRRNVGYQLWGLLTLFLWLKKWDVETVPARESCPEFSEVLAATN
jgi:asparagine synthase (glutamine-hydrolysing)